MLHMKEDSKSSQFPSLLPPELVSNYNCAPGLFSKKGRVGKAGRQHTGSERQSSGENREICKSDCLFQC